MANRKGVFIGAYVPAELKRALQQRAVKNTRLGQSNCLESFLELLGIELLGAVDFDLRDCRPFLYLYDEDVTVGLQSDILEKSGGVQGLDRGSSAVLGYRVANFDGEI